MLLKLSWEDFRLKILVDTHTHTISSGHAYSTILENAKAAKKKGLLMIAMTDHGPSMEGAPTRLHFSNLRIIPHQIDGVRILKGIEANIVDYDGSIDLSDRILKRLDFVIASLHDICIKPSTVTQNTKAILGALKNPLIDAIGHPGNPTFPVDIQEVVLGAKEFGKFIEINNHSFVSRKGSEHNCREFVKLCKKHEVKVVCGSDAHYCDLIGNFDHVIKLFEEEEMPEHLIMNADPNNFENYIRDKKKRLQSE
jgi:putative hydrolase